MMKRVKGRLASAMILMLGLGVIPVGTAQADDDYGEVFKPIADAAGVHANLTRAQVANLVAGKDRDGQVLADPWQYLTTFVCAIPTGGAGDTVDVEVGCSGATLVCAGGTELMRQVLGRPLNPDGSPKGSGEWTKIGTTCLAEGLPGNALPSLAMIREAFHTTNWATATVDSQPEGNATLVNLPTYFRVTWSAKGFEPGEVDRVDPARMLGAQVSIRPRLVGLTYHFGDGAVFGPTRSSGGVWPDGDVVHTYTSRGGMPARVEVEWGADFRIGGGEWTRLPDTVSVEQPVTTIQVREARAVLVND
jgi:hypothetical protein